MEAIVTVVGSFIAWEILFQLSSTWLRHGGIDKLLDSNDKSSKSSLLSQGPSYIVSIVHSALLGVRGMTHLTDFLLASGEQVNYFEDDGTGEIFDKVLTSNLVFFGYLIYDLYHVLLLYPKLGGPDMVLHHLLFMTCCVINGYYRIFPFQFGWLILGELSTFLLSVRWLLIKTGRGSSPMFHAVQLLFAIAFLVIRVIIYNIGVWHMIQNYQTIWDLRFRVPAVFLITTTSLILAGAVLNIFWSYKIYKMALSPSSRREKKSE
mmetsp:Transcript_11915/g.18277  ORF Transcript_11915/g.18277 Transcript_11915/m.18277 type:complete len:263 (-) Transcript_11915:203-991(-)